MKQQKYSFLVLGFLLSALVIVAAVGEGQHRYNWDKVDEKVLNERQPPLDIFDADRSMAGNKMLIITTPKYEKALDKYINCIFSPRSAL